MNGKTLMLSGQLDARRPAGGEGVRPQRRLFGKRTVVGFAIFVAVLLVFLTQTRLPATLLKFETIERAQTARGRSAFSQVLEPESFSAPLRWVAYGVNLWDANAIGMFFAVLLGGAAVGAFAPGNRIQALLGRQGAAAAGMGGVMGLPLFMCSACSAPVSLSLYRNGAAVETSLGLILGSALFNPVGMIAIFLLFPAPMALARVAFGLVAILMLAPLVGRLHRARARPTPVSVSDLACPVPDLVPGVEREPPTWRSALGRGLAEWLRNSTDIAFRLVPPMLVATFLVGVVLTLVPPQQLAERAGSGLVTIIAVAVLGTLLQLPTLFEIPLVLGVLALGLGEGPAAALLVTAPSAGVVTLGITRSQLGWRTPLLVLAGTLVGGIVAGLAVTSAASWL